MTLSPALNVSTMHVVIHHNRHTPGEPTHVHGHGSAPDLSCRYATHRLPRFYCSRSTSPGVQPGGICEGLKEQGCHFIAVNLPKYRGTTISQNSEYRNLSRSKIANITINRGQNFEILRRNLVFLMSINSVLPVVLQGRQKSFPPLSLVESEKL